VKRVRKFTWSTAWIARGLIWRLPHCGPSRGIHAAGVLVHGSGRAKLRPCPARTFRSSWARRAWPAGGDAGGNPPGKIATERFLVNFPDAGWHEITAGWKSDAVEADNHRYWTMNLPPDVRYCWSTATGSTRCAIPEFGTGARRCGADWHSSADRDARYLSVKPLATYPAIIWQTSTGWTRRRSRLSKDTLPPARCAFFLGERSEAKYFKRYLVSGWKRVVPVPLARQAELMVDRLEPAPDVQVGQHFIFRIFAANRNTFLHTVSVGAVFRRARGWRPPVDSTVRVAARLRNAIRW